MSYVQPARALDSTQQFLPELTVKKPMPIEKTVIIGKPMRITIPSLNIEKDIIDGVYNSEQKTWNVEGRSVHYALPTRMANDSDGNTLLYGHNNKHVFGSLKNLSAGDLVQIFTENNKVFTYKFLHKSDYVPSDTSIFNYSGPPILTLQTCSGPLNEFRSLYLFKFEGVT
jgi:LPXTG-site transpeptidase (sortase) family protein